MYGYLRIKILSLSLRLNITDQMSMKCTATLQNALQSLK